MKKKLLLILSFACMLCLSLFLVACKDTSYFISIGEIESLEIKDNVISVEYGNSLTVPQGVVTDADGEIYDLTVTYTLVDDTGKDITKNVPMYELAEGKEYTLTYRADTAGTKGIKIDDLTYKVVCKDTLAPEVTVMGVKQSYNLGEKFLLTLTNVSDASYVDESTVSIKVFKKGGEEVALNVNGSEYSFDTTESGAYELKISAMDSIGNKLDRTQEFKVYQPYVEPQIENVLWGFEDVNAFSNVQVLSGSDDFNFEVTDARSDPAKTNSTKSLKLSLADDTRVKFELAMGNETPVVDVGEVYLRVYSTGLIDEFRVANTIDYRQVSFDYDVLKKTWTTLSFVALERYKEGASINSLSFEIWVEEAAEIYIDGIYYTDYVAPWADEALEENQIATFDKPEYYNRIGDLVGMTGDTYGGVVEYLEEGEPSIPAGAKGGVIKFTSNSDLSSKYYPEGTSDGFYYDCGGKISLTDLDSIVFRAHFGNYQWSSLHVGLVTDFGTIYAWNDVKSFGGVDDYEYFLFSKAYTLSKGQLSTSATYFTGMYIRVMKSASTPETSNLSQSIYFDEISIVKTGSGQGAFQSGNYNFDDFSEFDNVSGTVSLVKDEGRMVLKGSYKHSNPPTSTTIRFDDLDMNEYEGIYVLMKFDFSVGKATILVNGTVVEYTNYPEYTYVNIKQLVAEYNNKYKNDDTRTPVSMVLSTFAVRDGNPGTLYIDKIIAVPKGQSASFEFTGESDLGTFSHAESAVVQFVEDTKATDYKAVKVSTPNVQDNTGIILHLGGIDVADYQSIKLRIRAEESETVNLQMNGVSVGNDSLTAEYIEIDILALAQEKGVEILDTLSILRPNAATTFYIDSVILVKK